jgi:hypothetical protein
MPAKKLNLPKVMKLANQPVRRRIIEQLGSKGPLTWKELSSEVGMSTGPLYFHLDILEDIVTRDSSRRYVLTDLGMELYHFLEQNLPAEKAEKTEKSSLDKPVIRLGPTRFSAIRGVIAPRSFIYSMNTSRLKSVVSVIVISIIVVALVAYAGVEIVLFSFFGRANIFIVLGSYALSFFAVTVVSYFGSLLLSKQKPDVFVLLSASSLAFLPVIVFAAILHFISSLGLFTTSQRAIELTLLLAVLQAWCVTILGSGMSVASGLRIERTLVIGTFLMYISLVLILVQGGRI